VFYGGWVFGLVGGVNVDVVLVWVCCFFLGRFEVVGYFCCCLWI